MRRSPHAAAAADRVRLQIAACPEPGCGLPTEVFDEVNLTSTSGPIAHARTLCVAGHRFFMPVQNLHKPIDNVATALAETEPGWNR